MLAERFNALVSSTQAAPDESRQLCSGRGSRASILQGDLKKATQTISCERLGRCGDERHAHACSASSPLSLETAAASVSCGGLADCCIRSSVCLLSTTHSNTPNRECG